ncbi:MULTISPECIES: response regulator [Leisingera]|jgi:DNA-binding response OmpR family regulator|uniref:response regulator n=1 Tax=Leisingera TaxID=191028 RepID=UPI00114EF557|nr:MULTISPECIES: response regulator [Leisingera]QDI76497.1 response regulator [Leisingera aquaemixtae]UWQ25831.1 response regulator [Leisingera aquaemixtae]
MDDSELFAAAQRLPTTRRPLLGLTILVVEDSRFACEALRLLCLRSGARIRRADCLKSARRHLQVYRPSVLIADVGLPDGSGLDLIRELAEASPRPGVILATSGDPALESAALEAGAAGFLEKPITSLAAFQQKILANLPADRQLSGPRAMDDETVEPDLLAYRDDMAHAADVLSMSQEEKTLAYLAQFLGGVARSAGDGPLAAAADRLDSARLKGEPLTQDAATLAGLVQERLDRRAAI